jgi:hypothetical protein
LFGLEKSGALQLIDSIGDVITRDARILAGTPGRPPKLRKHLNKIVGAFRNRRTRPALPYSIRGFWKADLVVGYPDAERWVGTSVKINPAQLEGAPGLRIGIVPTRQGRTDRVRLDENRNLVICPLHHDEDFMQVFYEGWRIVQAFIQADANVPREVALPLGLGLLDLARLQRRHRAHRVLRLILDPSHGAAVARRSVRLPAPVKRAACALWQCATRHAPSTGTGVVTFLMG